jgi:hypothetical protein
VDHETYGQRSTSSTRRLSSSRSHQSHEAETDEKLRWTEEQIVTLEYMMMLLNNLNICNLFNFNICLTQELMNNVIHAV